MDLLQKERKNYTYSYENVMMSLLYRKDMQQDERLEGLESGLEHLRKLISSDEFITNDNQFLTKRQNTRFDDYVNHKVENEPAESRLEMIVQELNGVDDKKLQVQIVGELVDEIRGVLEDIPKQKNNYRRQTLLMLHEVLKQNYTRNIFCERQVKVLLEAARVCGKTFVSREQYLRMDDIFCDCDLDMMPDLE